MTKRSRHDTLYHAGTKRVEATSTGVTLNGDIVAGDLSLDGDLKITSASTAESLILDDTSGTNSVYVRFKKGGTNEVWQGFSGSTVYNIQATGSTTTGFKLAGGGGGGSNQATLELSGAYNGIKLVTGNNEVAMARDQDTTFSNGIVASFLRLPIGSAVASGASGTAGDIKLDANYVYICTAPNTWKRAALTGSY